MKTPGAISWSELQTSDLDTASDFYSSIFGWELQSMMMEDGKYVVGNVTGKPIGGMCHKVLKDIPTTWLFYVTVTDVDKTIEKAESLGAKALVPPWDAPGVGRMGVFRDPSGAVLHVVTYDDPDHEAHQTDFETYFLTHGAFSWFELRVPDTDKAIAFYKDLFGWEVKTQEMSMGPYHTLSVDGVGFGAIYRVPAEHMPPHWGTYVTVDDADDFAKSVTKNGGKVMFGPADIPSVGRFVMFSDPQGAVLSGIEYRMPETE